MSRMCWCGRRVFERTELPNRRAGENFDFFHGGLRFIASTRGNGIAVAEVFLNCAKIDSSADLLARDAAVILSIALQYGVELRELAHALGRNEDGTPSSPIGALLDILTEEHSDVLG
jgi:hypothetical protein